ncbi:MAG: T9SS type A sorting domain-containing protein, partial [Bacteroidota bacterium]
GINHANEGKLTFLWNDPNNEIRTLSDGTKIIDLLFEANAGCENEMLEINSSITAVEAYDKDFVYHNIVMKPSAITLHENEQWSVSPNPTINGQIQVQMNLNKNKSIVFKLTDKSGKTLMVKPVEGVNGSNNFILKKGEIPSGIYYLQAIGVEGVKQILINY